MNSTSSFLQAVVFDYGTVLSYAPTQEEWETLAATAGRPLEEFQTNYWGYRPEYDRAACGAVAYWQAVARRALDRDTLKKLIELDNSQWTRLNPSMVELSRRLRAAGAKTGVLSNMQFEMLTALRSKFPWLNEFQVQIYSCEIRMVKPELEIYQLMAAELGIEPSRALFLDDKEPNVEAAREAGMKAMLFDAPEKQAKVELLLREAGLLPTEVDQAETAVR